MWISFIILSALAQEGTLDKPVDTSDNSTYIDIYKDTLIPLSNHGTTFGFDSYTTVGNNQVLRVGCSGTPYLPSPGTAPYNTLWHYIQPSGPWVGQCNPFYGDTPCYFYLPILCFNRFSARRPNYPIPPWTDIYHGWTEGILALTTIFYQGSAVGSKSNADHICYKEFGAGWQMAHFNQGIYCPGAIGSPPVTGSYYGSTWPCPFQNLGGWHYYAWGVLNPTWTRFWVYVWNKPSNCF